MKNWLRAWLTRMRLGTTLEATVEKRRGQILNVFLSISLVFILALTLADLVNPSPAPTMIDSLPSSNVMTLPETGASSMFAPFADTRAARSRLAAGLTVLIST